MEETGTQSEIAEKQPLFVLKLYGQVDNAPPGLPPPRTGTPVPTCLAPERTALRHSSRAEDSARGN